MGFLSGITDALFGDPNQSLNAQQKANKRTQQFIEEQTALARGDVNSLYRQSQLPLQQGYQAAIDALGGTLRSQLGTTEAGSTAAQQALLAGMPQYQAAILGMPVNNNAMQATTLHPEFQLPWLFNTTLGTRTGGHNPFQGLSESDIAALQEFKAAGLTPQQVRDLWSAGQVAAAQGSPGDRELIAQIYNQIYGGPKPTVPAASSKPSTAGVVPGTAAGNQGLFQQRYV